MQLSAISFQLSVKPVVGERLDANQSRMAGDRSSGFVAIVLAAAGLDY
jgi:hypothetical protein